MQGTYIMAIKSLILQPSKSRIEVSLVADSVIQVEEKLEFEKKIEEGIEKY